MKKESQAYSTVITHDHYRLRAMISTVNKPKTYLVFFNGRAEWIEKYQDFRQRLQVADDCAIITWDHRGQGESEGQAYHVKQYQDFINDAQAVLRELLPPKARFGLIAHSMGGLISLMGVLQDQLDPDYLILCSPLLMMPNRPLPRHYAQPLARLLYHLKIGPIYTPPARSKKLFHGNPLTHSHRRYQRLSSSPLVSSPPSYGWVHASFAATDRVLDQALLKNLKVPVLVLSGSREVVVGDEGFSRWVLAATQANPTAKINHCRIPLARHELLNEIDRFHKQVLRKIQGWSERHNVALPQFEGIGVGDQITRTARNRKTSSEKHSL